MRILFFVIAFMLPSGCLLAQQERHEHEHERVRPEDVLVQFERDYVLLKKGKFEIEENFTYTFYSANQIFLDAFAILDPIFLTLGKFGIKAAKRNIFVNTLIFRYGLRDNVQLEFSLPVVYRYDTVSVVGTSPEDKSMDRFYLGDIAFGVSVQPIKETATRPAVILSLGVKTRTGKGPFDIDLENDVPTGTGYYSVRGGVNLVKSIDPVVLFGGFGYIYNLPEKVNKLYRDPEGKVGPGFLEKVYPGDTINFSIGMAYALSYTFSITTQFIQNYTLHTYVVTDGQKRRAPNSALNSALLKMGAGMAVTPKLPVSFSVYVGLSDDAPDYILELRIPIRF